MAQERRNNQSNRDRSEQSRPRGRKRSTGRTMGFAMLYFIMVIGISALLACVGWIAANDVLALNKDPLTATVTVTKDIENDMGAVSDLLKDNGLIEYKPVFRIFAAITGGKEKVVAGTFTLNTDMDYRALIAGMSQKSATKAEVSITIPEGYTVAQIFTLLETKGVASVEDLSEEAANWDYGFSFLQDIPLGEPSRLEGFLYPDTYIFTTPHDPRYVINKMLVNFDSHVTDKMRQDIADNGQTIYDILTIASLIERETDGSDRSKIASVIYNRINNPNAGTMGYLQIDATLYYITGKTPTEADKSIDSPYNTYKYKGLPAGPIANPGLDSIKAAMNPDDTGYYYYALGDDNVHHYSKTYDEHVNFINSQERYK